MATKIQSLGLHSKRRAIFIFGLGVFKMIDYLTEVSPVQSRVWRSEKIECALPARLATVPTQKTSKDVKIYGQMNGGAIRKV